MFTILVYKSQKKYIYTEGRKKAQQSISSTWAFQIFSSETPAWSMHLSLNRSEYASLNLILLNLILMIHRQAMIIDYWLIITRCYARFGYGRTHQTSVELLWLYLRSCPSVISNGGLGGNIKQNRLETQRTIMSAYNWLVATKFSSSSNDAKFPKVIFQF